MLVVNGDKISRSRKLRCSPHSSECLRFNFISGAVEKVRGANRSQPQATAENRGLGILPYYHITILPRAARQEPSPLPVTEAQPLNRLYLSGPSFPSSSYFPSNSSPPAWSPHDYGTGSTIKSTPSFSNPKPILFIINSTRSEAGQRPWGDRIRVGPTHLLTTFPISSWHRFTPERATTPRLQPPPFPLKIKMSSDSEDDMPLARTNGRGKPSRLTFSQR